MDESENTHRLDELEEPALDKVSMPEDDLNTLKRGFWAGAVVMLGVALDKTDAEILASFTTELGHKH